MIEVKAILTRTPDDGYQTLGALDVEVWDTPNKSVTFFKCSTLELPWKDNQKKISCIPKGTYKVVKRSSEKYKEHFYVLNVPNRDYILIHNANFKSDLLGCIGVGDSYSDIDKDGHVDVLNSKATLAKLYKLMPDEFELTIV